MNLYFFYRTDEIDWEQYTGFVIAADTKEDAISIKSRITGNDMERWKIKLIGIAKKYTRKGIILESFLRG